MRITIYLPVTVLLFTMTISSCSKSPVELVKHYAEVYNRHDVGEIVSLYADDAVFEVVDQFLFDKKEQIRGITEYDSVLHLHMMVSHFTIKGDTVFCDLVETNDWLETAGIGFARYSGRFVFKNKLIAHMRAEALPETTEAMTRVVNSLLPWAQKERPQILRELIPEGRLIFNAESAKKFLTLLTEWKQLDRY